MREQTTHSREHETGDAKGELRESAEGKEIEKIKRVFNWELAGFKFVGFLALISDPWQREEQNPPLCVFDKRGGPAVR